MDRFWNLLVALFVLLLPISARGANYGLEVRPTSAAVSSDGKTILVVGPSSGAVHVIDVAESRKLTSMDVGQSLTAIARVGESDLFAITDGKAGELVFAKLSPRDNTLQLVARTRLARSPHKIAVGKRGDIAISSLWQRTISIVDASLLAKLDVDSAAEKLQSNGLSLRSFITEITLPFNPGEALFIDESRLLVADHFGGDFAIIDLTNKTIATRFRVEGHQLRGLAIDERESRILFTRQLLDETLPTTLEHQASGKLLQNQLCAIKLSSLPTVISSKDAGQPLEPSFVVNLDKTLASGAADPSSLVLTKNQLLITLAGRDELMILARDTLQKNASIPLGKRPLSIAGTIADGRFVVVENLSDSISIVDSEQSWPRESVQLSTVDDSWPQLKGERLFFSGATSATGSLSCHSCHIDGHTHGLKSDTQGDATTGAPKRTLTLLGTSLTDRWSWTGQHQNLTQQVEQSLVSSMQMPKTIPLSSVSEITAYLHTLAPPPPLRIATTDDERAMLARGSKLFIALDCKRCHIPPLTFTAQESLEIGISDELGQKKFNPPSLRGVGQGKAFLHDSRAKQLREVFEVHGHQLPRDLSKVELDELLFYLESL